MRYPLVHHAEDSGSYMVTQGGEQGYGCGCIFQMLLASVVDRADRHDAMSVREDI